MDQYETMDVLMKSKNLTQLKHELDCLPNTSLLSVANKCLDYFTMVNYAGFIEKSIHEEYAMDEEINEDLSFGCNSPYKFARSKLCLWLAKTILIECRSRLEDGFMKSSLTCRLILLWQYLLKEPASELRRILNTLEDVQVDCISVTAATEALLERMYAHLLYNQVSRAEICLKNALVITGLKIEIIGVLGKRTRFQEKFIPQLVARATGGYNVEDDDTSEKDSTLPPNILLHDDSLLENICIAETDTSNGHTKLSALSLACMLASGVFERKIQSIENLVIEKCCSYLNEIIAQRKNWAVQASALLQRSEFEKISMRRVERACMQMESLSKLMKGIEIEEVSEETLRRRLKLLLASGMKPFWYVDLVYAEILRSIGCTAIWLSSWKIVATKILDHIFVDKSNIFFRPSNFFLRNSSSFSSIPYLQEALIIFEKQENWDNVIDCYQSLGQLGKAERLIRDLLAKNGKEPIYWCLLGDILHEPSAYKKAIEISNGRSFRAHRSLGLLMLQRKHYHISYQHLKRSLELQPINSPAWFNFGCCAWKLEKWEEAAKAYRECVRYEPAHFQAWNNLAAVYERLNNAERAKALLQEALKLNFEHMKLRENYVLLCIRTHDFSSAISAFHALLDLDKHYKDDLVIEALTQKLIALKEENERFARPLIDMMCELLGRMTSQQTCSPTIWHCYAELKRPNSESPVKDHEIYVKLLERVFRTCYNKQDWHKDVDSCVFVLNAMMKLEDSKKVLSKMKNVEEALVKSEIRMTVRPVIASIEKAYGIDAVEAPSACLKESLLKVKAFLSSYL